MFKIVCGHFQFINLLIKGYVSCNENKKNYVLRHLARATRNELIYTLLVIVLKLIYFVFKVEESV